MKNKIVQFLTDVRDLIRAVESILVDTIAAVSPWLAPVIPAYLAFHNMTQVLGFPAWVGLAGAVVVEFLGLSTVHTTFTLWDYNNSKRVTDQRAPVRVAGVTAGAYVLVVLVVNVVLDSGPIVNRAAITLLSLLTVIAAITLAIRANHARRLAEIEEKKAERRGRKPAGNLPATYRKDSGNLPESGRQDAGNWRSLPADDRALIAGMSSREIVDRYGISERTARNWRQLAAAGQNGRGSHESGS